MEYRLETLLKRIQIFKEYYKSTELHKSIRKPNFPEDISENIVKIFLNCDKASSGDLYSQVYGKIEVKCFSSEGPISFGPKESWNVLVILDAKNFMIDEYYLHFVDRSSKDFNFKCNKIETYKDQCLSKRRPRTSWKKLQIELGHFKSFKILVDSSFTTGTVTELPASLYRCEFAKPCIL